MIPVFCNKFFEGVIIVISSLFHRIFIFVCHSESYLVMQVFSAFGFVHKITTFEKTAGFQVCIFFLLSFFSLFSSGH